MLGEPNHHPSLSSKMIHFFHHFRLERMHAISIHTEDCSFPALIAETCYAVVLPFGSTFRHF